MAPEQNPSEFLLELKRDYKNVVLHGNWNEEKPQSIAKKSCPLCGYPMQLKYKRAYGLRLYICTNEPEICGFMTNDYRAGKLCIQKCDKCRDGLSGCQVKLRRTAIFWDVPIIRRMEPGAINLSV